MNEMRHMQLAAASNPRRAAPDDAAQLARLFASVFLSDSVMDWIARVALMRP